MQTTSSDTILNAAADTSAISKIHYSLAAEFGSAYTSKLLTSKKEQGYTGYLYQHMTFGATPSETARKAFDVLTAIGIIATWASTPVSGLIGLAAWTSSAAGYYVLMQPAEFKQWLARVYYQKEVKVEKIYPYRVFKDIKVTAVTGSKGYAALGTPVTEFKSSDYDKNADIISTGITNYIRMN